MKLAEWFSNIYTSPLGKTLAFEIGALNASAAVQYSFIHNMMSLQRKDMTMSAMHKMLILVPIYSNSTTKQLWGLDIYFLKKWSSRSYNKIFKIYQA